MDDLTFLTTVGFVSEETPGVAVDPPAAPSSLTAVEDDVDSIDLAWTNGTTYDTLHIERKTTGAYSEIAEILGTLTAYEDTTVVIGTEYTYKVRGKSVNFSAYSNEATDTLSVFAPSDVTGLSFWLDANSGDLLDDGGSAVVDGSEVRTWPDQSGSGFNATQATGSAQPTFRSTGGANSQPCVEFTNAVANQYLLANAAASLYDGNLGNRTTFIVYTFTNVTVPGGELYVLVAAGSSTGTAVFDVAMLTETNAILNARRINDAGALVSDAGVASMVAGTFRIYSDDGSGSIVGRLEGTSDISFSVTGQSTHNRLAIGAQVTNSTGFGADAKICEVLIYNVGLTTSNYNLVGDYLATKYGLTWNTIS